MPARRCTCPNCKGACHEETFSTSGVCFRCEDGLCKKEEEAMPAPTGTSDAPQRLCPMCGQPEHGSIACSALSQTITEGPGPGEKLPFEPEMPKPFKYVAVCDDSGYPTELQPSFEVAKQLAENLAIQSGKDFTIYRLVPLGRVSIKREVGFTPIPQRKRREKKGP